MVKRWTFRHKKKEIIVQRIEIMNKKEFLLSYIKKKNKGDTIRRAVLIGKIENEFNLYPGYSRQVVDEVLSKQLALGKIERYSRGVYKIK